MSGVETAQIALNHLGQIMFHADKACRCRTDKTCRRNLTAAIRSAQRVLTRINFGTLK